jgi:hypothetical protein
MPTGEGLFACRCILFVDDEFFLADDLRQILHEHHAEIFRPAATITDIRRLLARRPLDGMEVGVQPHAKAAVRRPLLSHPISVSSNILGIKQTALSRRTQTRCSDASHTSGTP